MSETTVNTADGPVEVRQIATEVQALADEGSNRRSLGENDPMVRIEPEHLHRLASSVGTLADALDGERQAHATTQQQLAEEQAAHVATAGQLAAEKQAHDTERQAHQATADAFAAYRDSVESTNA